MPAGAAGFLYVLDHSQAIRTNAAKILSILLALVLCLSACCAGIAEETAAEDDETLEAFFTLLFSLISDAEPIDWKGFEEEFNAKVASGAEITMEDCLPAEAWKLFNSARRTLERRIR